MRIPQRVRQFPNFASSMVYRAEVLRREPPGVDGKTFVLCFFSCESYFRYLYCSLHSIVRNAKSHSLKIIVFNDAEQPITHTQHRALEGLVGEFRMVDWPKSMGWGAEQIGWIWKAYALAAEEAADDDYIARVDSDVFFFNDRIFRAVKRSDADFVGDGHFVRFEYAQGGCYFFKASAVRAINALVAAKSMERLLGDVDVVVEDVAASRFARRLGLKTWLTWFMMFPDELRNAGGLTPWQRWKFSCAHFVMKNKELMIEAYEREMLEPSEIPVFQAECRTK